MPGVAQPHRSTEPRVAVATDPEGDVSAAVVLLVAPGGGDRPQVVVGLGAALVEPSAERVELLPGPSDPDAEDQPTAAQVGEVGRHPGDEQGMPVRHDEDRGAEPHPFGDPGQPRQRGEGLVERGGVLVGDVRRDDNVVRHHQQVEPLVSVHELGPATQYRRVGARAEVRNVHAKQHGDPVRDGSPNLKRYLTAPARFSRGCAGIID
jgi:hypothetical protein